MIGAMDDARVGRAVRGVRIRKGLRQADVGTAAGVAQDTVSRLERGELGGMTVDRIRAIGAAVGVLIDLQPRWHGGELDGLLGARHSALHEAVAARLATLTDWTLVPEATFSEFGERGAVDILAWHAPTRTVLVIELKTEIVDVQEMLGTLDRKRRLARSIARVVAGSLPWSQRGSSSQRAGPTAGGSMRIGRSFATRSRMTDGRWRRGSRRRAGRSPRSRSGSSSSKAV